MKTLRVFVILSLISGFFINCKQASPSETTIETEVKEDPLPSWNEGPTKRAIMGFVETVTKEGSPGFVPVKDRIATFDNDGNLLSERPLYFQLAFAIDRVKAMADQHPEWSTKQPFKGVLEDDMDEVLKTGMHGLMELVMASHATHVGTFRLSKGKRLSNIYCFCRRDRFYENMGHRGLRYSFLSDCGK